jgi:hypothetical protein
LSSNEGASISYPSRSTPHRRLRNQKKTNPASSASDARSRVRPFARRVAMCRSGALTRSTVATEREVVSQNDES